LKKSIDLDIDLEKLILNVLGKFFPVFLMVFQHVISIVVAFYLRKDSDEGYINLTQDGTMEPVDRLVSNYLLYL
jgi:hypothetical protein